jgi:hypothetical protein
MFTRTDGPFRIEITTEADEYYPGGPDGDCYTPRQVKAYRDGDWSYVVLHGRVMIGDAEITESYLGGVEAGWFVMTDEQDNVTGEEHIDPLTKIEEWYADFVAEMIDDARTALGKLANVGAELTAHESEAAARGLSHGWDSANYADAYGRDEALKDEAWRRALELYPAHTVAREAYAASFLVAAENYAAGTYPDGSPRED